MVPIRRVVVLVTAATGLGLLSWALAHQDGAITQFAGVLAGACAACMSALAAAALIGADRAARFRPENTGLGPTVEQLGRCAHTARQRGLDWLLAQSPRELAPSIVEGLRILRARQFGVARAPEAPHADVTRRLALGSVSMAVLGVAACLGLLMSIASPVGMGSVAGMVVGIGGVFIAACLIAAQRVGVRVDRAVAAEIAQTEAAAIGLEAILAGCSAEQTVAILQIALHVQTSVKPEPEESGARRAA